MKNILLSLFGVSFHTLEPYALIKLLNDSEALLTTDAGRLIANATKRHIEIVPAMAIFARLK